MPARSRPLEPLRLRPAHPSHFSDVAGVTESRTSVEFESYNSVAVLAFARDDPYPRLTRETLDKLEDNLREIRRPELFRGVVIASNAHSFVTGADIQEIAHLRGFEARRFAIRGQRLLNSIASFPVPVVAAMRGHCLGGGLDLALACHGRVAAFDSSFGHPGGALGLITGWGGTQRLPRLLGRPAAMQILLTGERIPATQALAMGLIDELVPSRDLIERAVLRVERASEKMQPLLRESAETQL
jgi:enoyl-CoA hydratase